MNCSDFVRQADERRSDGVCSSPGGRGVYDVQRIPIIIV